MVERFETFYYLNPGDTFEARVTGSVDCYIELYGLTDKGLSY